MNLSIHKVYDSRGNLTIASRLKIRNIYLTAFAPAGKSTGSHEVIAFPKNNIENAFAFFEKYKEKINYAFGFDNQEDFDNYLKEISDNLLDIGGSLSISLSLLHLKYLAFKENLQVYEYLNSNIKKFPKPLGNVIGGGLHSKNNLPIQEILVAHLSDKVRENISKNIEIYHRLEKEFSKKYFFGKNDEGALSLNITLDEALDTLKKVSFEDTKIGMDIAANSFYKNGYYYFDNKEYSEEEFIEYLLMLNEKYNFLYLEDPFYEDHYLAFARLQKQINGLVCGDDLYTTNVERILKGIRLKATKAVLIKPNQIGTVTDTYKAVKISKENNMYTVLSHRSGETCDPVIAHLALGWETDFIKTGTVSGERLAKLNELLLIEDEIDR